MHGTGSGLCSDCPCSLLIDLYTSVYKWAGAEVASRVIKGDQHGQIKQWVFFSHSLLNKSETIPNLEGNHHSLFCFPSFNTVLSLHMCGGPGNL